MNKGSTALVPSSMIRAILLVVSLVALTLETGRAQTPADELFRTIESLDSAVFAAYNTCDLDKFKSFFTDDLEFYHDQGGLTVGSKTVTEQVKANICGKVRRELVPGTLQVYPIKGYGAVEIGIHRFYQEKSGPDPTGEAKFIHLWQKKDGAWKITRVISYDHAPLKSSANH